MKKAALLMPHKGLFYGYLVPLLTITLFLVLIGITIVNVYYRSKKDTGEIIANDVQKLAEIFNRIEQTCSIISVEPSQSPINFLTVRKGGFTGSEIGSLNLAKPESWEGPYLQQNPEVQGIEYQLVTTHQGYFVVPGNGVKLPNGKEVGKDIIIDETTDLIALMRDPEELEFNNRPLAAQISFQPQLFDEITAEELAHAQSEWIEQHNRSGAQLARL